MHQEAAAILGDDTLIMGNRETQSMNSSGLQTCLRNLVHYDLGGLCFDRHSPHCERQGYQGNL